MDAELTLQNGLRNQFHSLLLLSAMGGLLLLLGYVLAGGTGALFAVGLGIFVLLLSPRVAPGVILRLYGARPLSTHELGQLHPVMEELARRSGLARYPPLYYIPSSVMNAFTVGKRDNAAIGVTDGILRKLTLRELAGVLAHEISHLRNGDLRVMTLADVISRITANLSMIGQVLILINLPLFLMGRAHIPWIPLLLLLAAPTLSALMQLALSRTREFDADMGAVRLTGDPLGLASALEKMERYQGSLLGTIFAPGRRSPDPSLLRSHPHTEERIRRLLSLEERPAPAHAIPLASPEPMFFGTPDIPTVTRQPRYRYVSGLWH